MPDVLFALTGDVRKNSRGLRQLQALQELGCSVTVLTLGPTPVTAQMGPRTKLRVLKRPSGSGPSFFWQVHQLFQQTAQSFSAAVYHASDLYTLPALSLAARKHNGRVAFDSRELYPYVAATANRPWVRWFWKTVEHCFIPTTDAVFTVSESIARQLARTYRIPHPRVLPNVPFFQDVEPSTYLQEATGITDHLPIILHQGSMQKDRGCERLVRAMNEVDRAVLVFLGNGPLKPALQRQVQQQSLHKKVHFVAPVPPDQLLPVTASADIGVTLLEDSCRNHRFALPNKLFEYLMAGLPVLASDLPEIGTVVRQFNVGALVNPADQPALAHTLQQLVDHPEQRKTLACNTSKVFETYNWEQAARAFKDSYQELL